MLHFDASKGNDPDVKKQTTECRISTLNSSQRTSLEQRQNASAELGLSLYKWQTVLQF